MPNQTYPRLLYAYTRVAAAADELKSAIEDFQSRNRVCGAVSLLGGNVPGRCELAPGHDGRHQVTYSWTSEV